MLMERRSWIRLGLVVLAVPSLQVGTWAVVATSNWFAEFPGFGRGWTAAEPPYNEHLATDAGAGFLALGVVLALAAWWLDRRLVTAALVGALAFMVPHTLHHLIDPALDGADLVASQGSLVGQLVLAAVLLVAVVRSGVGEAAGGEALSSGRAGSGGGAG